MMQPVRTTITLEPDVIALVQKLMADRQLSFKDAVNFALRDALAPPGSMASSLPVFDMGEPRVPLEQALRLAGELEDEEIARKMSLGQ